MAEPNAARVSGVAVAFVVGAFVISLGASAGATVWIASSGDQPGAETASPASVPPSPASPSAVPSTAVAPPVQQVVAEPTKAEIRSARSDLCAAEPANLPRMSLDGAPGGWTLVLERLLWHRDLAPGDVDRVFTSATSAAVRALQESLDLRVTGVMDQKAWGSLQQDTCPGPAPSPPSPAPATAAPPPPSSGGGGGSGGGGTGGGTSGGDGTLTRVE